MDIRYRMLPSDNKSRGEHMIVKELITDGAPVHRDRDFETLYFVVLQHAEAKLEELDKTLP